MDDREQMLGFKPQKEIIYNRLLPYADKIDEESNRVFAEIKGNLARAVQLRDLKVGSGHWVGQLTRYMRLYGMKFSKEDHILLVKLMYELVTVPDLELSMVQKFGHQLVQLLKKKEMLSRDDLELDWRPLYKLIESVFYSPYEQHGLLLCPPNIENSLKNIVRSCRTYFSVTSTQEMLDEWRPLLCPFDVTVIKGLSCMELFLPTSLPPEQHDKGFKLWFEEIMEMWDSFHNNPTWENSLVSLLSRLAHDNIGHVDWSPFVSKVFNRLLRSFNLPVGTQTVQVGRSNHSYDIHHSILWIVSMMGGDSCALEHIERLFKILHTFYHPSNLGKWNIKLSSLLMEFPKAVIRRLHRERYRKPSWENQVPESHKLKDTEVTRFVDSMREITFTSMFSKFGSQDSAVALRHLGNMRPELIVPTLLEKMYPAMETLIEPHRLIACMNCVVSVARSMLKAGKWYPEGPSHVLPLLNLSLPGIDPNDFKKSLVTFQMISTFVSLVPIVDCSEAVFVRNDLTENERELCSATAQFEDFVLQFVDRSFALIENSAQEHTHGEHTRLNPEQSMLEVGLASTFTSVLQQCSTPIYESALNRLHNFITSSVYETRVGGRFASNLCRAAAKVNPAAAIKRFMPTFCDNIKHHIDTHEDVFTEEHLDDEFLWNLLMLSQLVRCNGKVMLPYKDRLLQIVASTLKLKCIQGYEIAGQMLRYLLRALTLVYPMNYRSIDGSFDHPVAEYLAIRDWAKSGDIDALDMEWHIPSDEEVAFASELLKLVLHTELGAIKQITAENQMDREELLRRLNVILETLLGAGSLLPMWEGENLHMIESSVPLKRFGCKCYSPGLSEIKLGGRNVRLVVMETLRSLLSHMKSSREDDTKSLFRLMRIYETVLFYYGAPKNDFDARWKSFHVVKSALADKMRGGKRHIRALLVDRVQLQHELRLLNSTDRSFTVQHKELIGDLFDLSVSRYGEVRKKAQQVLFLTFNNYPYSYRFLLPQVVENLKNPEVPEHEFKGTLYLVLGNGRKNLATKRSWEVIEKVWPAIVQAQHSEKPSILKVIDDIVSKVVKNVEITAVKLQASAGCLNYAKKLLETSCPRPTGVEGVEDDLQAGAKSEVAKNAQSLQMYTDLVNGLVDLVQNGNLTWKFSQIGLEFLSLLLRYDTPPPPRAVETFVKGCVHDSIYVRKLSLGSVSAILKLLKRPHKKIKIDPYKVANMPAPPVGSKVCPGDRADNSWHQFHGDDLPSTKEKWDDVIFVEKTHWGYYCWPKELEFYAPSSEQPRLCRQREEMSAAEQHIYDSFSNTEYVQKLVDFLSLEENKGKDKFKNKHLTLFKGLFRNFGETFLPLLKPHIERLMSDTSHDKHETSQRCAMEMLSGLLRGSKHWSFEQTMSLWDWAIPIMKSALNNITVETIDDWGNFYTMVSESRDPRKMYRMFELLLDNPLSGEGGSFGDASRLFMVHSAIIQQEWRVPELLQKLFTYLTQHLSHPYKNVREKVASLLANVLLYDYKIHKSCQTRSPLRVDFISQVLPQLEKLKDMVIEDGGPKSGQGSAAGSPVLGRRRVPSPNAQSEVPSPQLLQPGIEAMEVENHSEEDEERKTALRTCKTVMKYMTNSLGRMFVSAPAYIFPFLPVMCTLESETKDEELKQDCSMALACFSQALLQPHIAQVSLDTVKQMIHGRFSFVQGSLNLTKPPHLITGLQSWHARAAVLTYIQVMVFCNFFTLNKPHYKTEVREIVLHLLCDDQLEVREMAAITLSGLLHCGYLDMDKDTLDHFERLSRTKLMKRQILIGNGTFEALIQRHAGVLGLSAYIQAYPYEVPEFMPQILMDISNHVNDPQPIQMTVKKTLSNFRRTHHDNWHDHKRMFTDDQLVILTDLLVSPNYYA